MAKDGSINPIQKGSRRQRLHSQQDNVGDDKNKTYYKNYKGEEID